MILPSSLSEQWPWLVVAITAILGLLKFIRDLYEARLADCKGTCAKLEAQNAKWEELSYTSLAIAQRTTELSVRVAPKPGG